MQTKSIPCVATVTFKEICDPAFYRREDTDGATIDLDLVEEAVLDLVNAADNGLTADEWDSLAGMARQPEFAEKLAELCEVKAAETRRIDEWSRSKRQ